MWQIVPFLTKFAFLCKTSNLREKNSIKMQTKHPFVSFQEKSQKLHIEWLKSCIIWSFDGEIILHTRCFNEPLDQILMQWATLNFLSCWTCTLILTWTLNFLLRPNVPKAIVFHIPYDAPDLLFFNGDSPSAPAEK